MFIEVVFPAPLGPSIPKHSPHGTASDKPRTAYFSELPSFPEYAFFRLSQIMAWDWEDSWSNFSTSSLWKETKRKVWEIELKFYGEDVPNKSYMYFKLSWVNLGNRYGFPKPLQQGNLAQKILGKKMQY